MICVECVSLINRWETFYDTVHKNEHTYQVQKEKEEVDGAESHIIYEMENMESEEGVEPNLGENPTRHQYTVMCITKPEEPEDCESSLIEVEQAYDMEEEVVEEDQNVIETAADTDGEVAGEQQKEDVIDVAHKTLRKRKKNTDKDKGSLFTPKAEYLSSRDIEDEVIRQTVVLDCDVCFESFQTFDTLLLHYKDEHNNEKGYVRCCNKQIKRRYVLLDHVRLHIDPTQFTCSTCDKRFTTRRHLADHTKLHIPEEEREFPCTICQKRYATSNRLQIHMKTHEDLRFECHQCAKVFKQENILKNHIQSVHENKNQRICEICAKVFKTKGGFCFLTKFIRNSN